MIYFDNAATTLQKPPQVQQQIAYALAHYANPGRGGHSAAMEAAGRVYRCRELAAKMFDAEPEQICFTMNATHGLNIAIKTLVHPGDRVVISGFEHNAVTRPLHSCGAKTVVAGTRLFSTAETLSAFQREITEDTTAVIVNHVSNVFGYIQPLEEIADICNTLHVPLIVDASQSAGALPLSVKSLGCAFMAMPGHKGLYGPQGTGILICTMQPEPLLYGGTGSMSILQEMPDLLPDRVEAGTVNTPGICGLAAGMEFVMRRKPEQILRHEQCLLRRLVSRLSGIPGCKLFSRGGNDQSGVLSFQLAGLDCEEAAQQLGQRGIAVRAGLHCAPLAHRSAGTVEDGTIRVSFSAFNTEREVDSFARAVAALKYPKDQMQKS